MDIYSKFNGKKTYTAAIIAVLGSALAYFSGETTLFETMIAVGNAVFAATIRHGIKVDIAAVTEAK